MVFKRMMFLLRHKSLKTYKFSEIQCHHIPRDEGELLDVLKDCNICKEVCNVQLKNFMYIM